MTLCRRNFFALVFAPLLSNIKASAAPIPNAADTLHAQYLKDLAFLWGDQWPAEVIAARRAAGRPCLVQNRIAGLHAKHVWEKGRAMTEAELSAFVREHRDPQVMYNYLKSAEVQGELSPGYAEAHMAPPFGNCPFGLHYQPPYGSRSQDRSA